MAGRPRSLSQNMSKNLTKAELEQKELEEEKLNDFPKLLQIILIGSNVSSLIFESEYRKD